MISRTHKTNPKADCPQCKYPLDSATAIEDGREGPQEGDYTVCSKCFIHLKFRGDLTLKKIGSIEMQRILVNDPNMYGHMRFAERLAREAREAIEKDSE